MTEPSQNPILIGHDEALRQIAEAFKAGRMHHAWLISGIEGIGKATLAWHIAHHLLSNGENPLGNIDARHPAAKLVAGDAHPDLLVVQRTPNDKGELRDGIIAEDARKIAPFLQKTAAHGGWRVVIVDEAHTLNRHSQNSILKILEEPPPRVLIVMTATSPGNLLPTIRSRCRQLALAPLNDAAMRTTLARFAPEIEGEELTRLITLSGGSVGFALKIVRAEALPLYEELLELIRVMPELDISRLHKLADRIGRKADAESFAVVTTLLSELLRRDTHARATGKGRAALPAHIALDRILQLWDRTRATFALAETANLDRKLAFIKAVSDIRRAVA